MDTQLSKSEKKRRAKNIEQLVLELVQLPESEIAGLPCEQEILAEIRSAKNLKGGARKRQLKYATKLLREMDVDDLFDYLARQKGSQLKKNREFHNLEHLRNLLISEAVEQYEEIMHTDGFINENEPVDILMESRALETIVEQFPEIDTLLLKNTAMQFARTRNKKFTRELFRLLKAAQEKRQYAEIKEQDNGV